MKKYLYFILAFIFTFAIFAVFTAFDQPTDEEKVLKKYEELKTKKLNDEMANCLKTAVETAMIKYEVVKLAEERRQIAVRLAEAEEVKKILTDKANEESSSKNKAKTYKCKWCGVRFNYVGYSFKDGCKVIQQTEVLNPYAFAIGIIKTITNDYCTPEHAHKACEAGFK